MTSEFATCAIRRAVDARKRNLYIFGTCVLAVFYMPTSVDGDIVGISIYICQILVVKFWARKRASARHRCCKFFKCNRMQLLSHTHCWKQHFSPNRNILFILCIGIHKYRVRLCSGPWPLNTYTHTPDCFVHVEYIRRLFRNGVRPHNKYACINPVLGFQYIYIYAIPFCIHAHLIIVRDKCSPAGNIINYMGSLKARHP